MCDKLTLKQFLVNCTSASGSLQSGMIIIKHFLVAPKFIESCFKYVSRFSMRSIIRQTIPQVDDSVSKKITQIIILYTTFVVLNHCLQLLVW